MVELHDLTVEITTSIDLSCMVSDYQEDGVKYTWKVIQIRVCKTISIPQCYIISEQHYCVCCIRTVVLQLVTLKTLIQQYQHFMYIAVAGK